MKPSFWKRLHTDDRGNVLVLYMAASLLIVAMLWAIIGTGARFVQKETIQTSADAAAFSAAVVKAKGLNIIAFCNLLMALLLAIIVMLRMVVYALALLGFICYINCDGGSEDLCEAAPTVTALFGELKAIEADVEPEIKDSMTVMQKTAQAVSQTFPALAAAEAYKVGTNKYYKDNFAKSDLQIVVSPLPIGSDLSLPTEDGTTSALCDQATKVIDTAAADVIKQVGVPIATTEEFTGFFWAYLGTAKSLFCDGAPKPLVLKSDWKDHKDTTAYSIVTDSNVDARRKSVAIVSKTKLSSPILSQFVATAEAEYYAQNGSGHDDLWHMDWRARLERYTVTTTGSSVTSVLSSITSLLSEVGGADLQTDYMVH